MFQIIGPLAGISFQTYKVLELAKNVTESTTIHGGAVKGAKLLIDVCSPPQIKYPLKCTAFVIQFAIALSGGGPVGAALAISSARQLLMEEVNG
jgi:hypothetical protein